MHCSVSQIIIPAVILESFTTPMVLQLSLVVMAMTFIGIEAKVLASFGLIVGIMRPLLKESIGV